MDKYSLVEGSISVTSTVKVGWFGWELRTKVEGGMR